MLQIDEMRIQVSGLTESEGNALGRDVAERLASDMSPIQKSRQIDSLNLRLSGMEGMGHTEMVNHITSNLLQQLNSL